LVKYGLEEEEYPCLSATLQYRALFEDSFEQHDISSYNYSTNDKITANRIFDLKYRIYDQKKFSWICINSTNLDVYDTYKNLI
jgi:hypothetical protein